MRMRPVQVLITLLLVVFPLGCGGSSSSPGGSGSTPGRGGMITAGGTPGSGSAIGTGGTIETGGVHVSGGASGSGGVIGSGGVVATGGEPGSGRSDVDAAGLDSIDDVGIGGALDSNSSVDSGGALDIDGRVGTDGSVTESPLPVRSSGCGFMTLPAACDTATTGPCSMAIGGITRQYFVVMPSNYDTNKPTPVVFAWHYAGGTAQGLLPTGGGINLYGVREGFPNAIYVVP